jgi:Pvc16 N-terminal domain
VANFNAIPAAGKSIERLLNLAFAQAPVPVPNKTTKANLVRTEDFDRTSISTIIVRPALSIFLYRVDFNKTMRAAWSGVTHQDGRPHLPLDLHFLITPWADNAEAEGAILGRAMQALDATPILSGPLLHQSGDWAPNEAVNLLMDEISTEAVMRTFDSLAADYRISVPYIARVVRLDGQRATPAPDVTTVIKGATPVQ